MERCLMAQKENSLSHKGLCKKNNEGGYVSHTFYSFEDFKMQLARRNREYNNFPMRPMGWKSPREALSLFLSCVTYV